MFWTRKWEMKLASSVHNRGHPNSALGHLQKAISAMSCSVVFFSDVHAEK